MVAVWLQSHIVQLRCWQTQPHCLSVVKIIMMLRPLLRAQMWRIQRSHAAGSDVKCPAAGDRAISFEASVFELLLQQRASGELLRVLDLFSKAVSREERHTLGDEIQLYRQSWCNVSFGRNTATGPSVSRTESLRSSLHACVPSDRWSSKHGVCFVQLCAADMRAGHRSLWVQLPIHEHMCAGGAVIWYRCGLELWVRRRIKLTFVSACRL
mmetsp:Transcript_91417/g.133664  ORF Transcript_91417/g.133664 Transcript_91417/m.133664 type:complete len:211 (+) Transcript_91417:110-742(+)